MNLASFSFQADITKVADYTVSIEIKGGHPVSIDTHAPDGSKPPVYFLGILGPDGKPVCDCAAPAKAWEMK